MKKTLHSIDELLESPQYGWDQLQAMLDKKLPLEKKQSRWMRFLKFAAAALFISLLLLSSLVIKNTGDVNIANSKRPSAVLKTISASGQQNTFIEKEQTITASKIQQAVNAGSQLFSSTGNISAPQNIDNNFKAPVEVVSNGTDTGYIVTGIAGHNSGIETAIETTLAADTAEAIIASNALPVINEGPVDSSKTIARNKNIRKKSWHLSGGFAFNAMLDKRQNLRPYPVAELRYNISHKVSIATGLSFASPVTAESRAVSKRVYLNDTANNVRYYNNINNYYKLNYIDIPVIAAVNLNKRWAVMGGVQASILLNSKSRATVDRYDFQMNVASGLPAGLTTGVVAPTEENYHADARKLDYRLLTGLTYTFNKTILRLSYQYSPRSVLKGEYVSKDKNQFLSMAVLFKIK